MNRFLITLASPASPARPLISWRQAADDVHAATMTGEYAGHVVENDLGFTVYGPLGQRLVALPSLAAARTALEDFSVHPVTGPAAIADRSSGVPISSAAAPSSRFHGSLPWSQTKKE